MTRTTFRADPISVMLEAKVDKTGHFSIANPMSQRRLNMISRRRFCQFLSSTSALAMGQIHFSWVNRAMADPLTVAVAVISVYNALKSMEGVASGAGLRFSEIDLKLDQIIANQITTLKAIGELQEQLSELYTSIDSKLVLHDFLQINDDVINLGEEIRQFLDAASLNPARTSENITKQFEYSLLLSRFRSIAVRAKNLFASQRYDTLGDLQTVALAAFSPAFIQLVNQITGILAFQGQFPNMGWDLADYRAIAETIGELLESARTRLIPARLVAEEEAAVHELAMVEKTSFGRHFRETYPVNQNAPTSSLLVFQTPVYGHFEKVPAVMLVYVADRYRFQLNARVNFKSYKIKKAKPIDYLLEFSTTETEWGIEKLWGYHNDWFQTSNWRSNLEEYFGPPDAPGARDGLHTTGVQDNRWWHELDMADFRDQAETFKAHLIRLNNRVAGQVQLSALDELLRGMQSQMANLEADLVSQFPSTKR